MNVFGSDLIDDTIEKVSVTIRLTEENKYRSREMCDYIKNEFSYQDEQAQAETTCFVDEERGEITFVTTPLSTNFVKTA